VYNRFLRLVAILFTGAILAILSACGTIPQEDASGADSRIEKEIPEAQSDFFSWKVDKINEFVQFEPPISEDDKVFLLADGVFEFLNTDCERTNSCDLIKVEYEVSATTFQIDGIWEYGNSVTALYETALVEDLTNYAFVQFYRGCVYEEGVPASVPGYNYVRDLFGEVVPFKTERWVIDSIDRDPVYNSFPDNRHALYLWNQDKESFDEDTRELYGNSKPPQPALYIIDYPINARRKSKGGVINVWLDFRLCLFKTTEVPVFTTPDNLSFAEPLNCFEWGSKYVYDFKIGEFIKPKEMPNACREED